VVVVGPDVTGPGGAGRQVVDVGAGGAATVVVVVGGGAPHGGICNETGGLVPTWALSGSFPTAVHSTWKVA
jgi:hypothetical protein